MEEGFAYEASLVLQYAVGLISDFPAGPSIPVLDGVPEEEADTVVPEFDETTEDVENTESEQTLLEPDSITDAEPNEGQTEADSEVEIVNYLEAGDDLNSALLPDPVQIPKPEEVEQNNNNDDSNVDEMPLENG